MGLKERGTEFLRSRLRPWLLCEVFPVINVSRSGLTLELPHLEFNVEVLNRAGMESSSLVIKEAVKVENVHLVFSPFQQPVVTILVEGLHLGLEPRAAGDAWWEKKREKTIEQKQTAALACLDPQGSSAHAAAQGLAEGEAGKSLISRFLTSLVLSSFRIEFRSCLVRVVSHVHKTCQHVCHIPLSRFEFGESSDDKGSTWSGGLFGAVTTALHGVWKKTGAPTSKHCSVRGLGLQVETHTGGENNRGSRKEEIRKEIGVAEINEIAQQYLSGHSTSDATPKVSLNKVDRHVVFLEDLMLSFRFKGVAIDALELDAPEATFGFEFEEIHALQIIAAQIKGPAQDSLTRVQERRNEMEKLREPEDEFRSQRSAVDLWKRGIQKAVELSSRRRLTYALEVGVSRRRYSRLYESWLIELGWGQRRDNEARRNQSKTKLERLRQLSEDISEMQKKLPLEAVALARRVARHRVSAAIYSNGDINTDVESVNRTEYLRNMYSSFQVFLGSFWRVIAMVMIYIQGKAIGLSMWKSIRAALGFSTNAIEKEESVAAPVSTDDDSQPDSSSEPSSTIIDQIRSGEDRPDTGSSENHFHLGSERQENQFGMLSGEKKGWAMTYALKIKRGSITLTSGTIAVLRKVEETYPQSKGGELELDSVLIPAVCLSWEKMVLAYGSAATATGTSAALGSLKAEMLSVLPSQLPDELSAKLDIDTFHKEFSSLGRWTAKVRDKTSVLSSCPCPQKSNTLQAIDELSLGVEMYQKHWIWQDRQLKDWDRCWPKSRNVDVRTGDQSTISVLGPNEDSNDRPFLIAEFSSLGDDPSTDDYPGGWIECAFVMGRLNFSLKSYFFAQMRLLIDQLKVSQTATQSSRTDTKIKHQSQSESGIHLEKIWNDSYDKYLSICREAMVAAIPEKSIRFSGVIDGPRVRLFASATELHEYQQEGNQETYGRKSQHDPNVGATVIVDFGRLELAMWPPQKKESTRGVALRDPGNESYALNDWWTNAVESKLWVNRPPAPALPEDLAERRYWEHEQVGNNVYMSIEGVTLILAIGKESSTELPVVGPLGLVIQASLCWDQFSSLFNSNKSVSAGVSAKISSLLVHSYMHEMSIILQVIDFLLRALKSSSNPKSPVAVRSGDSFLTPDAISQQEEAKSSVTSSDSDSKLDCSPSIGKYTACSLSFSMEFEKLRCVLGDVRKRDGYQTRSRSASGVEDQIGRNLGSKYGPQEEQLQSMDDKTDDADNWKQNLKGVGMGKDAYILIPDGLLHISLGDGEQFCMFTGIKGALMWLVDSGSVSGTDNLTEVRNQFFSESVSGRRFSPHFSGYKFISGLVLTEVCLEYFSLKAFGPSSLVSKVDENDSPSDSTVEIQDVTEISSDVIEGDSVLGDGDSVKGDVTEDQGNSQEKQTPIQLEKAGNISSVKNDAHWLAANMEVGKIMVTDGSLDTLVAKVILVVNGGEKLQLDCGLDRDFRKISFRAQGGLVLIHTRAVASLVEFCGDIGQLVSNAVALPMSKSSQGTYGHLGQGVGLEERLKMRSLSSTNRSSSVPVPSIDNRRGKLNRISSAPPREQITEHTKQSAVASSPPFEGVVFTKIAGFSLVLARHSIVDSVPAEGVLFEVELSAMLEVGPSTKKASLDLSRFTILGIQAQIPGNARKTPGRIGSRTPQFGSTFRVASDVQSLSMKGGQLQQPVKPQDSRLSEKDLDSSEAPSESDIRDLLRPRDQPSEKLQQHSSSDVASSSQARSQEEEMVAKVVNSEETDGSHNPPSITKQAQGFHEALSEFNSFILEKLSVSCAIERVVNLHKVWKWTDAWHGQCSIVGLDVAITTSEIQLLESLVNPLSSLGKSSKSTILDSTADALIEESKQDSDGVDVAIPDGAIIAIKDVREHCYLAAEEMHTNKGHYRLIGVLHYTLAGEKALFKVKYQDVSGKKSNPGWCSLLSLHAKNSSGEPFRVHYRPGSGLADISSTNDGSWEQWQFVPAESSKDGNSEDLDIQNPSFKHLFHLVNQKSKSGIAFEENVPVMVKKPGNPFKVKIVAKPPESDSESHEALTQTDEMPLPSPLLDYQEAVGLVTSLPQVICTFDTFVFTVLHEAAGGLHLLPLLRAQVPGTQGVIQAGLSKTRAILQCSLVLEYYETQSSMWVSIINPIGIDFLYRARSTKLGVPAANLEKTPVALFSRFKKVGVVISEPSLDACLFLIGTLGLAGPYTVRYSPVRANRCLVENHTGVDMLCRFDQGSSNITGRISSWCSDSFLMRHMTSRRDSGPTKVASFLEVRLQQSGKSSTSPVLVTLGEPGVIAIRTRLETDEGQRTTGPMVVVDISRRSQDGIFVRVSPMIRIRNASGLPLELRCRREAQGEEGAVVVLEDGDSIDDSIGAFDALNLEGELKKALSSFSLGNYRLSIRPAGTENDAKSEEVGNEVIHEWSEDVKGAKPVRAEGLFAQLQFSFNKTVKARNVDSKFGVVFCPTKVKSSNKSTGSEQDAGQYFLIRTSYRQVPISRPKKVNGQEQKGRYAVVAWQQQQELLLLPTVRVLNFLTSKIAITLTATPSERKKRSQYQGKELQYNAVIESGGKQSMYMDLGDIFLTIKQEDLGLVSKPTCLGSGSKEVSQNSKGGSLRDITIKIDFEDGIHTALATVSRGEDGVLEVVIFTRYALQNDSHVTLLCCASKHHASWWGFRSSKDKQGEWPSSGITIIAPKSTISWFDRSTQLLLRRTEADAQAALLDLESLSGSMEISLTVPGRDNLDNRIQLGAQLHVPSASNPNPWCIIRLVPRYIVMNDSGEVILVCQDGFQEDSSAMVSLGPGESSALHAQVLASQDRKVSGNAEGGPDVLLTVRFRPKETGWNWSGPVCVASLGSFSVKVRRPRLEESQDRLSSFKNPPQEGPWFAVASVKEEASSLIMTLRRQAADTIPYRIENAPLSVPITYNQQGLDDSEVLESGESVGYVWDDLGLPHVLTVKLAGSSLSGNINPDKLRSWKAFRPSRHKKGLLQIQFLNELSNMAMYGDGDGDGDDTEYLSANSSLPPLGYEVYADGPTRVVHICAERDSKVNRSWQSNMSRPKMELELRIPLFTVSIVEPGKQPPETERDEDVSYEPVAYVPVICLRLANVLVEALKTPEYTSCQIKAEKLDIDVKWQGSPVAAMLRGHGQDRFTKGLTVLHMAVVVSNLAKNPIQVKYASILLQAMDLNLDEDTLMKLAPFYRYSLSESTAPSRQIYFERFEIHPIKIVGSFRPGNPRADYSSSQETLRALLHSVIKIPTVSGTTVELNGVLLSNALLTFKQLALKCAQHYSWYAMRAIYIARGSKLLPPGFASLFDDSAASSLDVFFDPSNGSIDFQGLTIGMFGLLSRGLRKKGKGGTQRYLGDLQHTVKAAGSNLLFAVVTEISDSVVKGADASGFDGLLSGFRRGIVNVAMKPSVLRGAVVQGGSTRGIKLDRVVGTDEAYIEGYLQAMLDALFKQNYLRVKVMDDQVVLKNLPPNTTLIDEIVSCVRNFLIGEGLLAGESSAAALSSLRRIRGEEERRLGPTVIALCEQLLVIIAVRSLRRQTINVLLQNNITIIGEDESGKSEPPKSVEDDGPKEVPHQGFFSGINVKRAVTGFALSSALAYADGRICRHIPNPLVRRIVSGFLLSFVE